MSRTLIYLAVAAVATTVGLYLAAPALVYPAAVVFFVVGLGAYSLGEYRTRGLSGMPGWALPIVTWMLGLLRIRSPEAGVPDLMPSSLSGPGPAALAPRKLRCIAINPLWGKDLQTYFAPSAPIVDNVTMGLGADEAVILGQVRGLDGFERCPAAKGMIEMPGRDERGKTAWDWQELGDGEWVFIPPARIHAFAHANGDEDDTALESARDLVDSVMSLDWSSFEMTSMSPAELGGDLQLTEYRRQMRPPRLGELVRQLQTYILLAVGGVLLAVVLAFIVTLDSGGG